jgi:hypothetical protein
MLGQLRSGDTGVVWKLRSSFGKSKAGNLLYDSGTQTGK